MSKILEETANEFFFEGKKAQDIQRKREYFALSWAVNRYLERLDYMQLCTDLLESTGLDEDEIEIYQNKYYNIIIYSLDLPNTVQKILRGKKQSL